MPRKSDARSQSWTSAAQETCHCVSQGRHQTRNEVAASLSCLVTLLDDHPRDGTCGKLALIRSEAQAARFSNATARTRRHDAVPRDPSRHTLFPNPQPLDPK